MELKALLWDWRFVIIVVLAFVIWAIADFKNFKLLVVQVMLIAKSKAKDLVLKSGKEQEDFVVDKVYEIMPVRLKVFISKDLLRKFVQKLYHSIKDYLDDKQLNNSVE